MYCFEKNMNFKTPTAKSIKMEVNKKNVFAIIASIFTLLLCFFTLAQFVMFLSSHTPLKYYYKYSSDQLKNTRRESNQDSVFIPVIKNMILLFIFFLQHSLQANKKFKDFLSFYRLNVFERLLYNCGSCVALQIVMYFWQSIPLMTVWEVSTYEHKILWWIFTAMHSIAWLITYSGCCIMDAPELLGVKQVYHYLFDWPQPLAQKSDGLKRLYTNMRHPTVSALLVILFVHPVMQIDRLFLAYALTIYMIQRFKVDVIDYAYQRRMLQRKYRDLYLIS